MYIVQGDIDEMNFHIVESEIKGVYRISPLHVEDCRGSFTKFFSKEVYELVDINFSPMELISVASKRNVIRGIHFQITKGQPKILSCVQGKVWSVVVDLNIDSETFGKWINVDINDGKVVVIPSHCAYGSLTIEDSVILSLCGEKYYKEYDSGIMWNDPDIGINWPLELIDEPVLSEKDKNLYSLGEYVEAMKYTFEKKEK